jgi:RNA polymerase sigma factor (sigma-70 family)
MSPGDPSLPSKEFREELNARFQAPLMAFFTRRIGDRSEAQDLTQEVLLRVINAAVRDRIDNAESFVFKVAMNLLRDAKRKETRNGKPEFVPIDEALEQEIDAELTESFTPERVLLSRDSFFEALRTLDELGEQTRDIFVLFKVEKMKHKDIAALYGMKVSAVQKIVMNAGLHLAIRYGLK